jgi:hypothetical protein
MKAGRRAALAGLAVLAGSAGLSATAGAQAAPAKAAPGTTIIFSCGTRNAICTYDPTTGARRTMRHPGYLAGITASGKTYGYISATNGEIYEAPVAGGSAKLVDDQSQASPIAVMSSDGRYFLEQLTLVGEGQFVLEYNIGKGPKSGYTSIDSDTTGTLSYGFVGDTALTAHSNSDFTPPSWVCIGHQKGFCGEGATRPQIQSSRYNVTFPSGSPNGKEIVASQGGRNSDEGAIGLYRATTGRLIRTIARPKKGVAYSVPRFSPNGQQIVFEASPTSGHGASSIEIIGVNGKGLKRIAAGGNPFWGGA